MNEGTYCSKSISSFTNRISNSTYIDQSNCLNNPLIVLYQEHLSIILNQLSSKVAYFSQFGLPLNSIPVRFHTRTSKHNELQRSYLSVEHYVPLIIPYVARTNRKKPG
jgi:hypothetical protein